MKKIAIITGASSGIGKEFAIQINEKFLSIDEVWIIARRSERLEELADYLTISSKIITGDLSDKNIFDKIKAELDSEPVKIKMLVNSAGFGKYGYFEDSDLNDQLGMIDINIRALTELTNICIPYMAYNSRIINIASAAAFVPQPDLAVYAATKSYVLSFSRAINSELNKEGIYVTAVCPGPVDTEFFDIAETDGQKAWYKKYIMAQCHKVVNKAINDSLLKKEVSVYGIPMRLFNVICKIFPHKMILAIQKKL